MPSHPISAPAASARTADTIQAAIPQLLQALRDSQHEDEFPDVAVQFDEFARECAQAAQAYQEMAAWCRLTAGLARGEDVPESIYPQPGEDPAETARWQKWRMS